MTLNERAAEVGLCELCPSEWATACPHAIAAFAKQVADEESNESYESGAEDVMRAVEKEFADFRRKMQNALKARP